MDAQDGAYGLIVQIVSNTNNLKAFHFHQPQEEYVSECDKVLVAPRVPSSVESLSWQVTCHDVDAGEALHSTISGCSISLRALSLLHYTDIFHFIGSQSISLERLTHLKLAFWEDRKIDLGDLLQHSSITHIVTGNLFLRHAQFVYSRITSLSVTDSIQLSPEDFEHVFPDLEIFSFPTTKTGDWLRRLHHSSLQTIIIINNGRAVVSQNAFSGINFILLQKSILLSRGSNSPISVQSR